MLPLVFSGYKRYLPAPDVNIVTALIPTREEKRKKKKKKNGIQWDIRWRTFTF